MSNSLRLFVGTALAALALSLGAHHLQAAPSRQTRPAEATLELAAGAEGRLPINAFCLTFGKPFPKTVTVSTESASPGVIQVMKAAARSASFDVLQTQLALWHNVEGEWGYQDDDVDLTTAKSLVEAAGSERAHPLVDAGVPLDKAIADGLVTATVDGWQEVDAPQALPEDTPYYGSGTLVVMNVSPSALTVRLPLGLVLKASDPAEQDMALYAVTQVPVEKPPTLPKTGFGPPAGRTSNPMFGLVAAVVTMAVSAVLLRRRRYGSSPSRAA